MKTTIRHPRLGEVIISQTRRARRISISVRPPDVVRLSLPVGVSLKMAVEFLESKADWVLRAKGKMVGRVSKTLVEMPFSTRRHTLLLNPVDTTEIKTRVAGGRIAVTYPAAMNYADEAVQEAIRRGVERAWSVEAKEILPARLQELSRMAGLPFGKVSIRNSVSRWGSCSGKNDISLSLHLMRLPDHLIDYILLHELCHVRHKNHGEQFHRLLDELTGGRHEELRREIRKYHTRW